MHISTWIEKYTPNLKKAFFKSCDKHIFSIQVVKRVFDIKKKLTGLLVYQTPGKQMLSSQYYDFQLKLFFIPICPKCFPIITSCFCAPSLPPSRMVWFVVCGLNLTVTTALSKIVITAGQQR